LKTLEIVTMVTGDILYP